LGHFSGLCRAKPRPCFFEWLFDIQAISDHGSCEVAQTTSTLDPERVHHVVQDGRHDKAAVLSLFMLDDDVV